MLNGLGLVYTVLGGPQLISDSVDIDRIYEMLSHLVVQQSCREPDVYRCLDFVSSEDPYLNSDLFQCNYGLWHFLLQPVFNGRGSDSL